MLAVVGCAGSAEQSPEVTEAPSCPAGCAEAGFACDESVSPPICVSEATSEVLVPAGTFWMGCGMAVQDEGEWIAEPCHRDEYPRHPVWLSAYAIDRTEVTAGAYDACVAAGACAAPAVRGEGPLPTSGDPAKAHHPVNFVTWAEAAAWCAWSGKPAGAQRLCTEAEWEKAARGGCDQLGCGDDDACCRERTHAYPWGFDASVVHEAAVVETGATRPTGERPAGRSPYGALDLAGNVEEWVADVYAGDTYCRGAGATCTEPCEVCPLEGPGALRSDPIGPSDLPRRVLRGGGFDAGIAGGEAGEPMWQAVRASRRNPWPPDVIGARIGFRCCRSVN